LAPSSPWLIDLEHAPSARDLADALRTVAAEVGPVGQVEAGR
jgi:hypothetical protein